jgi:hypothetical protein
LRGGRAKFAQGRVGEEVEHIVEFQVCERQTIESIMKELIIRSYNLYYLSSDKLIKALHQ